ncbi:hypothetical protein AA0120_g11790 [Alternaria tenuissima]|nr:hypothetical protein AA0120_g11790 [Alternaria tenuissima]
MSTSRHETNRRSVGHDVEMRIERFKNYTIIALINFTTFIAFAGPLWICIRVVPSTTFTPPTVSTPFTLPFTLPFNFSSLMPFALRWICIITLYLGCIQKNWLFFNTIAMAGTHYILELEGNKRPQNQDLGVRTNDFEDWILANFCVIAGLSTIGFVVRYWYQVIALTLQSFFYWTCTMSGLWLLLCLLKRAMSYYRKVKGLKHEDAWGVLISVNVLRFYNRFEGCHADGVPGLLLDAGRVPFELLKFLVNSIGFKLGSGSLFDRLPGDWKAARRSCRSWKEVADFFAGFAGLAGEEEDRTEEDTRDPNNQEEPSFPPSAYEWEPNPVIHAHLRSEHPQSTDSDSFVVESTPLESRRMDIAGEREEFSSHTADNFDNKGATKFNEKSPFASKHTGPTTMSPNLSSFPCPQCTYVAKKRFELRCAITILPMSILANF